MTLTFCTSLRFIHAWFQNKSVCVKEAIALHRLLSIFLFLKWWMCQMWWIRHLVVANFSNKLFFIARDWECMNSGYDWQENFGYYWQENISHDWQEKIGNDWQEHPHWNGSRILAMIDRITHRRMIKEYWLWLTGTPMVVWLKNTDCDSWKPSSAHSISILTDISTQFLLQSMCVCVCICSALFYFIILYVKKNLVGLCYTYV